MAKSGLSRLSIISLESLRSGINSLSVQPLLTTCLHTRVSDRISINLLSVKNYSREILKEHLTKFFTMEYINRLQVNLLLEDVKASIQKFEAENSDVARVEALEKSLRLTRALEHPKDVVLKLFLSVSPQHFSSCSHSKLTLNSQPKQWQWRLRMTSVSSRFWPSQTRSFLPRSWPIKAVQHLYLSVRSWSLLSTCSIPFSSGLAFVGNYDTNDI